MKFHEFFRKVKNLHTNALIKPISSSFKVVCTSPVLVEYMKTVPDDVPMATTSFLIELNPFVSEALWFVNEFFLFLDLKFKILIDKLLVSCYNNNNNNKLVALGTYFFLVEFSEGIWFEIGIHAKQVHAEDDR